jgi:hypothetical protein
MVVALFMVLVLSVIGSSLIFVSRTETMSSLNYKTMSQTRYGAESAVHSAANHLLWVYGGPGTALDPIAAYDINSYPVRRVSNGRPVVLSSDPDVASNYPVDSVRDDFIAEAADILGVNNGSIGYTARATLLSMSQFTDSIDAELTTLQRWQIVGKSTVAGAGSAEVEVSAIIERQKVPVYKYAAFATSDECAAMDFAGGATTDSYDSRVALVGGVPAIDEHSGNVGTNGGLEASGNPTTIWGTLSSPRTGVGNCSVGNVTAFESSGGATVEGGLVELAQAVDFKTPSAINPLPPVTAWDSGDCAATAGCTDLGGGDVRFAPAAGTTVQLGNVSVGNGDTLYLRGGTYEINSIDVKGEVVVEPGTGPVYLKVAGTGFETGIPIEFTAGSISNTSYAAANFQIIYGGTGEVKLRGNAAFSAVVYAPNAETTFAGGGDFYGAVVTKRIKATGGASIHYDRALENGGYTLGNPVMSSFTWKSF